MDVLIEGKGKIFYNKKWLDHLSSKLDVFYNPNMRINRDFTVILVKIHSSILNRKLDILDSMAGTGIRSIRLFLEAGDNINKITIVDKSLKAIEYIKMNIELNNISNNYEIINDDCRKIMLDKKFDYIDIDPFGSPVGFIQSAILSLRNNGMLGVTATDISALSGSREKACFRKYNTIGIKTDFYLEFGLRNLIKYVVVEGLKFDIAMKPIFGYYYLHHYRVFFIKSRKSKDINELMENIKFIYYCPYCHYKKIKDDDSICPICKSKLRELGPIYIGDVYNDNYVEKMKSFIEDPNISDEAKKVYDKIYNGDFKAKDIWYYYEIPKIAKYLKIKEIPKVSILLEKFNGMRTHFSNLGIKTKAYPDLSIISK